MSGRSADRAAVAAYLGAQAQEIAAQHAALLTGAESSVHDLRVAVRRFRSTLRTFGAELPPADELDARLRAWGAALGVVRDREVLLEVLAGAPAGQVRDTLLEEVGGDLAVRRVLVQAGLRSPECIRLVSEAAAYAGGVPADDRDVSRHVTKACKQARRRLRKAGTEVERLHRARKAAKRARYAAEVVGWKKKRRRHQQVQQLLGVHRDCLVALAHVDAAGGLADAGATAMVADLAGRAEAARLSALEAS
ncbi:hypothetical protein DDE18_14080 [Nocardioides gansuensis]|uniref:CHAD domain-containing protein n=1 Tax=Nocardioides gansuensis TaxID=2138300 RepID=A0A2T8F822_9ACTN|nr:CHAD domain-containing protein [Nocardioides gansuensis]PVG81849.1 hypothetical protein DDE18_14080 [Nocardioides gansuensis]